MPDLSPSPFELSRILLDLKEKDFKGFEEEKQELSALLRLTVTHGESNSVLILGPRGTGKSALANAVLREAGLLRRDGDASEAMLVRLNGLLETNDRLALKKIARQLKLENVAKDKVFGSFSEHLEFLLDSLRTGDKKKSKPIIFILEEFDLFCHHHNQTLLYNLFDTAQSKAAPILVIGLTARIDVVEIMEKRVQSRFGRRLIHTKKITQFGDFYEYIRYFLESPSAGKPWSKIITRFMSESNTKCFFEREVFNKNPLIPHLKQIIHVALLNLFSCQEEPNSEILIQFFQEALPVLNQSVEEQPLNGLTMLDLTLVVACMHRQIQFPEQSMNFEMVYQDYYKFVSRKCSVLSYDRSVMMKCWENLIHFEVIRAVDRGSRIQNEYRSYVLNVMPEEIKSTMKKNDKVFTAVIDWANCGH